MQWLRFYYGFIPLRTRGSCCATKGKSLVFTKQRQKWKVVLTLIFNSKNKTNAKVENAKVIINKKQKTKNKK